MFAKSLNLVLPSLCILAVSCSNSSDVTLHKPGVYKGAVDPLIETQRSPQQQERLVARFNQVQTDR
jgi:hypothetical protein